jgi:hypothetical protein
MINILTLSLKRYKDPKTAVMTNDSAFPREETVSTRGLYSHKYVALKGHTLGGLRYENKKVVNFNLGR